MFSCKITYVVFKNNLEIFDSVIYELGVGNIRNKMKIVFLN